MTPTPTLAGLNIPSGTEIYDGLMAGIEPELTTAQIPLLEQKYKSESKADRAERLKRYEAAYAKYDAAYAAWIGELHQLIAYSKREALASAEADDRTSEAASLSRLETSFVS